MQVIITKEYTLFGAKLKLALIIWTNIWPTSTTKNSKRAIARLNVKKALKGCAIGDDLAWSVVYKKGGILKETIPLL
jgi:hypothetical protein